MAIPLAGRMGRCVRAPIACVKQTVTSFVEDGCPQMAAALAYYTIFALPSLLVIILNVAGFVLEPSQVQGHLSHELTALMGQQNAETAQGRFCS